MDITQLENILNEHRKVEVKNGVIINNDGKYSISLTLNPENDDDKFILKYVRGRKGNAKLVRLLLLAHFRTVEEAENVK